MILVDGVYYSDIEFEIRRLRSDLKDTLNPAILRKYPNLNNENLRQQIRDRIAKLTKAAEETKDR